MTVRNTTQSSLSAEYRRTDTRHDFAPQATPDSARQISHLTQFDRLHRLSSATSRTSDDPTSTISTDGHTDSPVELQQLGGLYTVRPQYHTRPQGYDLKRHSNLKASAI